MVLRPRERKTNSDGNVRSTQWRYGLPVVADEVPMPDGENGYQPPEVIIRPRERGIAIIIAIMIISMMMMFASDLILNSQVNLELAVAQRDNLKAEYMAKSGFNLALFLQSLDYGIDLFLASPQSPQKTAPTDSLADIWSALNGIPIGGESPMVVLAMQKLFGLGKVVDASVMDQLKLFDGTFTLYASDETQKINVNYCHLGRCQEVLLMLESLFSCGPERAFLDSKKIKPRELAYKIKDYIDADNRAESESGVSDENDPYSKDKYKTKNAPLDSIDELRMIDGWDEEVHAVFSQYLTAYPYMQTGTDKFKVNLNTASRALLGCLVPESKGSCAEKFAVGINKRDQDKTLIASGDVSGTVKKMLCYGGGNQSSRDTSSEPTGEGSGGPPKTGTPPAAPTTDPSDKTTWFTAQSNVFRLETVGFVGDRERHVIAVVERVQPDAKKNIKNSYRVLFWKLI